jgi:hypothetical protein
MWSNLVKWFRKLVKWRQGWTNVGYGATSPGLLGPTELQDTNQATICRRDHICPPDGMSHSEAVMGFCGPISRNEGRQPWRSRTAESQNCWGSPCPWVCLPELFCPAVPTPRTVKAAGSAPSSSTRWILGRMPTPPCCPRRRPVTSTRSSVSGCWAPPLHGNERVGDILCCPGSPDPMESFHTDSTCTHAHPALFPALCPLLQFTT